MLIIVKEKIIRAKSSRRSVHSVSLAASQIKVKNDSILSSKSDQPLHIHSLGRKVQSQMPKQVEQPKGSISSPLPSERLQATRTKAFVGGRSPETSEAVLIRLGDNHIHSAREKLEKAKGNSKGAAGVYHAILHP